MGWRQRLIWSIRLLSQHIFPLKSFSFFRIELVNNYYFWSRETAWLKLDLIFTAGKNYSTLHIQLNNFAFKYMIFDFAHILELLFMAAIVILSTLLVSCMLLYIITTNPIIYKNPSYKNSIYIMKPVFRSLLWSGYSNDWKNRTNWRIKTIGLNY